MKKCDLFGILFIILFILLVLFFPVGYGMGGFSGIMEKGTPHLFWSGFSFKTGFDNFGSVTKEFPYIMGFLKFALLATFGEMLKQRIKAGTWKLDWLILRAIVWGFFGIIMAIAFQLFSGGVTDMIVNNNWFGSLNTMRKPVSGLDCFIFALSTSFWMNLIFAYPMMLGHEWFNTCISKRKLVGGTEFFAALPSAVWGAFIPKTIIFFWIPAHTVTFLLPPECRVLMGAALSVALGFILTISAIHKKD